MSTSANSSDDRSQDVRLQRFLASCGLGSRRACEELVESGRVTIDGDPVTELGTRVDPDRQEVRLDGELLRAERQRYFLVHKPVGYVCTNRDPSGRPLAIDLVPIRHAPRLFTVGRLDESSEGLLLVTNDGELAHRLMHPRFRVIRTYRLQVAGTPTAETLAQLKQGLHFSDGRFQIRAARRLKSQGRSSFLEVEMTEGKNREIRRLFARVGHKVLRLTRVAFGPLRLGTLAPGKCRELRGEELATLREFAHGPLDRSPSRISTRRARRVPQSSQSNSGRQGSSRRGAARRGSERSTQKTRSQRRRRSN